MNSPDSSTETKCRNGGESPQLVDITFCRSSSLTPSFWDQNRCLRHGDEVDSHESLVEELHLHPGARLSQIEDALPHLAEDTLAPLES